jgi:acyl-CoA reductase-like NAD-dependent aldehyde dehydrogenase
LEEYIRVGKGEGATVAVGGGRHAHLDTGWYVEPTVYTDLDGSMRSAHGPSVRWKWRLM